MTQNKHKYFNMLLFLLPVIDLITSLTTRFYDTNITLGIVVKGLMLLYFMWYLVFITSSKYKKMSLIYLFLMILFVILYFIFKSELLNPTYILSELSYMFKFLFLPIMFIALLCFYDDSGFDRTTMSKILIGNIIVYSGFLLIPLLTNSAFNTYIDGSYGYIGWYFAANEISAIVILLFPFLYELISNKVPTLFLFTVPIIITISQIGTKVTFFGLIIVGLITLICTFFHNKKPFKNPFISAICIFLFIFLFMYNSYSINNMNNIISENSTTCPNVETPVVEDTGFLAKIERISKALLSDRDIYVQDINNIFIKNNNLDTILFGLGFNNTPEINNPKILKLAEIDLVDIFYHFGLLGLFLVLYPFFWLLYKVISTIKSKKVKFNKFIFFYGMMILLICGISCISGHVLLDPAVSIYIVLYFIFMINELQGFKKDKIKKDKVAILSLHLGYGGGERATVDLVNMICNKYKVELVSLYKTVNEIPYQVDSKIKIKYLTDLKPNRDEFKDAVKRKNIFKIFYQGVKALYILHLKKVLIRNYVEYSDAEIIISSRLDFTKTLNQYGRVETKKYGVEHNYRVDSKYVNEIKKYTQNIDGLVLVSKTATDVYRAVLPALKIKNIPNTVSEVYTSKSKLNTENLISVGRLEPEKGFSDLLDIMNLIVKENQDVKLTIIGDGSEKEKLNEKIKKLNLENNIDLVGFKTPEEINEYYKESSLYVMTSLKESFGIVLLETMKCGVPAIAFDSATGATEIIEDNQNGYLVKNRNKEEMAEKIIEYLSLKDKKDLQKNALDTAKKYTNEIVQEKWLKLLEGSEHNERLF